MNNSCFPLCLCKFVSFVEEKHCKKTHQMNIKIKIRCWRWNNNNNKRTRKETINLMEWKNKKQTFSLRHIISIQNTFCFIVFPHQNDWICMVNFVWWICEVWQWKWIPLFSLQYVVVVVFHWIPELFLHQGKAPLLIDFPLIICWIFPACWKRENIIKGRYIYEQTFQFVNSFWI